MDARFALDDFGTGLSSFSYLKALPVDYLKIDGGFVRGLVGDEIDQAMVEAVHHIGHIMGLKTIAEWVESQAILLKLRQIGVDYGQGYALGTPTTARGPLDAIRRIPAHPATYGARIYVLTPDWRSTMRTFIFGLCLASLAAPAAALDCSVKSGPGTAALVELYTSEGCNSCPPADRWVRQLRGAGFGADRVVPLSLHVDYWDHIGWKDPFAKAAFTVASVSWQRSTAPGSSTRRKCCSPGGTIAGGRRADGSRMTCVR